MPFKRVTLENAPDADANKRYGAEDDIQSTQAFEIRIEVVTANRIPEIFKIQQNFLTNKRACCCIPLACSESETDYRKKDGKDQASMQVAAVAVNCTSNEVLGFVQLYLHGMYCELHTVKPGEAYVDSIAVLPQARGMGIGTKFIYVYICIYIYMYIYIYSTHTNEFEFSETHPTFGLLAIFKVRECLHS